MYVYKFVKVQNLLIITFSRMSPTALNNEFFNKACQEWKDRLVEGKKGCTLSLSYKWKKGVHIVIVFP
jgi:hypothetical protein